MAKTPTNTDSTVIDLEDQMATAPAGVQAGTPNVPPVAVKSVGHDVELCGRKARITIHSGADDMGKLPVDISLNGYAYSIHRNAMVEIPVEVLEILQNAVQDTYTHTKEGIVRGSVPRFAYSYHGAVQ
ncbi:hypothetical protein [Cupriavidus sp. UYPR2.512]|uniref:hypothetical protein n=1 Tax=Cupriavidus sp. UYPR2.512 TaxID=1080187 RepID=UPI000376623F|nr:hypothetical protein [Cupriavidus sp. UYPR2.512]UIF90858.1 hypothetical protein KAF44_32230 [Cupriavidus necator]